MASDDKKPLAIGVNTMAFMWRASAREALEALARRGLGLGSTGRVMQNPFPNVC